MLRPQSIRLTQVLPMATGILRLTWDDQVMRDVDVRPMMTRHLVLEMLAVPEVFRDVSVVPGGGGMEWPNGADFSARSLRVWADEQNDMNARKAP